jgi:hypothetical protein
MRRIAVIALLFLAGCSTFRNTLAQDLAAERYRECSTRFPHMLLERIDADGHIWIRVTDGGFGQVDPWRACIREAGLRQSRKMPNATVASEPGVVAGAAVIAPTPLPVWKVGDEWAYRYEGAAGSGTFVWAVWRTEMMDGHDCYVIKTGDREIFYRKTDLAYVGENVSGVLVRRDVPPRPYYRWPLTTGDKWELSFTMENRQDRRTTDNIYAWEVVGTEQITVPAGSFDTYKIVSRNMKTGRQVYEMWYAPAVKQWVKIHESTDTGERKRELTAYSLR